MNHGVPNPVAKRLSLYLRELEGLAAKKVVQVSSRQLADSLCLTAAQVRKDLAYFGQFGRPGVGYKVEGLMEELRRILGTDKIWKVVVVGIGGLGGALLKHKGFRKRGFEIVAAFDITPEVVGKQIGSVVVNHIDKLSEIVRAHNVKLAIVAVPADSAQTVVEVLHEAGVSGIMNFAPVSLAPLAGLAVEPVDIAAYLEQLSFQVGALEIRKSNTTKGGN